MVFDFVHLLAPYILFIIVDKESSNFIPLYFIVDSTEKHAVSTSYANLANRIAPTRASSFTAVEDGEDDDDNYHPLRRIS